MPRPDGYILLAIMALLTAPFCVTLLRAVLLNRATPLQLETIVLGAITNFFDTLGVGSFAPTMAWFNFRRLVPDRLIPATMLAGHALPIVTQAAIFLILLGIKLDPVVLLSCIVAFVAGVVIGAPNMVDLSKVTGFEWDEGNSRKNEQHGVSMAEAEQVFFNSPLLLLPDLRHSETELRFHALGKTNRAGNLSTGWVNRQEMASHFCAGK